ncbi:MAG: 3,4-dihydroxy-2-butanone-4-phosphate synthase [Methanomassiliicoccales archaeon]|jgi:3,4-dihydroxy 2-butanone 4-phosphate synthase
MKDAINKALTCLKEGRFVLVYDFDNRERETDMVIASQHVTASSIQSMRKDAGGLICTTASHEVAEKLELPFMVDVLGEAHKRFPVLEGLAPNDIPYDTKSAFSITINHRWTFTGITDNDRALTTSEFARLAGRSLNESSSQARSEFGRDFRSPGHVHLLRASRQLLVKRRGHTELTTALLVMSGLIPSATICEMMGDDGNALGKDKAKAYAERYDLCYLEGQEIVDAWTGEGRNG